MLPAHDYDAIAARCATLASLTPRRLRRAIHASYHERVTMRGARREGVGAVFARGVLTWQRRANT